jgi:UDP-N-acetylmuramoyl-tripeptide--D-alanyl-D-alanine ligase
LTLGDLARHASAEHGVGGEHFDSPASLLHRLDQLATPDTTILIKGSRFMKMERIVAHLTGHPVQEFH